jgi:glucose-6-phosphate 1-dehydrogenase
MLGDQTLFNRSDFNELAWSFLMPVLDAWADPAAAVNLPLHGYPAGSWGPAAADELAAAHRTAWHNP